MATEQNKLVLLQNHMDSDNIKSMMTAVLKDSAETFRASLVDVYSTDSELQKCDPALVVNEALKAASLKLPISKGLGQAYLIAYKGKPQFQIGYKGFIQLAIRSGSYVTIHADEVYEGEMSKQDKLKGFYEFNGTRTGDKVIGFFAHLELSNGFSKTFYMSVDQVKAHAKKYSPSFNSSYSPWTTDFNAMAKKTVLKYIISHYGAVSVEMQSAFDRDVDEEIQQNSNKEPVTIYTDAVEVKEGQKKTENKKAPF